MAYDPTVIAKIIEDRLAAGETLRGVARQFGVSEKTVRNLRAGRGVPSVETIYKVHEVTGTPIWILIGAADTRDLEIAKLRKRLSELEGLAAAVLAHSRQDQVPDDKADIG